MLAVLLIAAAISSSSDCAYDRAAMLALTPNKFDQDMQGGWRPLARKKGCEATAADLLAAYRASHWGKLDPNDLSLNYWHEGQLRADIDRESAVSLLLSGVGPNGDASFQDYALGTVAFLLRDREGLQTAMARLRARPEPPEWKRSQARFMSKFGSAPSWPPNLDVLEGLLRCFDKTYAEAYGVACRKT